MANANANANTNMNTIAQLMRDYIENMNDYHSNLRHFIQLLERVSPSDERDRNNLPVRPTNDDTTTIPSSHTRRYFNRAAGTTGTAAGTTGTALYTLFPTTMRQHIQEYMEDVVVRPTQLQIENAVENFNYDPTGGIIDGRCPISLEDFVEGEPLSRIRHCQHVFKPHALNDWFSRNVHCPVCRYDIRETVIPVVNTVEIGIGIDANDDTINSASSTTQSNANTESSTPNDVNNTRHPLIQTLGNALHTFIQNEVENNGYMNEFMYTFDIPLFDLSTNHL
jgi:hypothetical protein